MKKKKVMIQIILTLSLVLMFTVTAFATTTGGNDISAIIEPLDLLKGLIISIVASVGVIILVKNILEFAVAFQQNDSHTMVTALKGIVAGLMMAGVSVVLAFLGF